MDGYFEWILPESFPAAFPDNKCFQIRSPVKWPEGHCDIILHKEDKPNRPVNTPKSYLERLLEDFPGEIIIADGNFVFHEHYWRKIPEGMNRIIVPIRQIHGSELPPSAVDFNTKLGNMRGEIERSFLIKHRFKRLRSKTTYLFPWPTLVHAFASACAFENIAKSIPRENHAHYANEEYFARVEEEQPVTDEIDGASELHRLRNQILQEYKIQAEEDKRKKKEEEERKKQARKAAKRKRAKKNDTRITWSSEESEDDENEQSTQPYPNEADASRNPTANTVQNPLATSVANTVQNPLASAVSGRSENTRAPSLSLSRQIQEISNGSRLQPRKVVPRNVLNI